MQKGLERSQMAAAQTISRQRRAARRRLQQQQQQQRKEKKERQDCLVFALVCSSLDLDLGQDFISGGRTRAKPN